MSVSMQRINLNGEWTLWYGPQQKRAARMTHPEIPTDWTRIPAHVPGNVELDLIRAGLLPEDLDKAHNIYQLRMLETNQWWFSRDFMFTETPGTAQYELVLNGVDTLAGVWLNGTCMGTLENMLIPHRLDVTDVLRPGMNHLVIGIDSTVLAAQEAPVDAGAWAMENIDLWWPRSYGEAALYDVRLDLLNGDGKPVAEWQMRYGFRTIKLDMTDTLTPEGDGAFQFVVNNEPIFVKGSNWIPVDALHSRDADRLQETLDLVVDLNCNMMRCRRGKHLRS